VFIVDYLSEGKVLRKEEEEGEEEEEEEEGGEGEENIF
jgi:hypothetical protein